MRHDSESKVNVFAERRPRRKWINFGRLAAVCTVVALWSFHRHQASWLERELDRIQAAGEPVTVADLHDLYSLPPDVEDATGHWLKALSALPHNGTAPPLRLDFNFSYCIHPEPEEWAATEKFLDEHKSAIEQLYTAAQHPGKVQYPIQFDKRGRLATVQHHLDLDWATRLLMIDAFVHKNRGDKAGVIRSIRALFGVARSLEREPAAASQQMRLGIQQTGMALLRWMLQSVEFSDEELCRFQEDLWELDYGEAARSGLLASRVSAVNYFQGLHGGPLLNRLNSPTGNPIVYHANCRIHFESMRELIDATYLPADRMTQSLQKVRQGIDSVAFARHRQIAANLYHDREFLSKVRAKLARMMSADAALAMERFRRHHHYLPRQLQELVPEFLPEIPIDPYTGDVLKVTFKEYKYGVYYTIYSVGKNCEDDDGREPNELMLWKWRFSGPSGDDIGFTVRHSSPTPEDLPRIGN